jgi:protein phosphatase
MSREEAQHSPMGHALWNVLGGRSTELVVDVYKLTLQPDDVLLLCTDGLYNMVPQQTLQELLKSNASAESACRKLVDLANQNGGKDNITVIVSHFLAPSSEDSRAFVEAEVPLEELTSGTSETSKTVVLSGPTAVAGSGPS